ncbi:hypothetical protein OIO90_001037 [Microbotryomycetes sp. JL221]|nr:hypothetical protein OIO90_001037 [Microbotryomycetes sp. JL221]
MLVHHHQPQHHHLHSHQRHHHVGQMNGTNGTTSPMPGKVVYLGKKSALGSTMPTTQGPPPPSHYKQQQQQEHEYDTRLTNKSSKHSKAVDKHSQSITQDNNSFKVETINLPSGYVKGELEQHHIEHATHEEDDNNRFKQKPKNKKKKKKNKAKAKMAAMLESIGALTASGHTHDNNQVEPAPTYLIEKTHKSGSSTKHGHNHANHHGQHHSAHYVHDIDYDDEVEHERGRQDDDDRRGRSIRPRLLWRSHLNTFTVEVLDKHVQDIRGEPMPRLREPGGSREGRKWSRELEKCGL